VLPSVVPVASVVSVFSVVPFSIVVAVLPSVVPVLIPVVSEPSTVVSPVPDELVSSPELGVVAVASVVLEESEQFSSR